MRKIFHKENTILRLEYGNPVQSWLLLFRSTIKLGTAIIEIAGAELIKLHALNT